MCLTIKSLKFIKELNNGVYDNLRVEMLFHSNKLEGSTFSKEALSYLLEKGIVDGTHDYEDIIETNNSFELFDFVVDTIEESLTKKLMREYQGILKKNTKMDKMGLVGCFKKIPNMLSNTDVELAQPLEVEEKLEDLLIYYSQMDRGIERIAYFHANFELIHPFQDGNGRVGRFIIFRQCIEDNISLIMIDEKYDKEYREALFCAQSLKDYSKLVKVFEKCQEYSKSKEKIYNQINQVIDQMDEG